MKLIKSIVLSLLAAAGMASAATVTLAPGFGTGIIVTADGVNTPYTVTIGGFEGGIFTQFGSASNSFTSGTKLGGAYAATGPDSLNGDRVFIRIDIGAGRFGIFQTTGTAPSGFFPSDVTSALLSSTANVNNTGQLVIASSGGVQSVAFGSANNINFVAIPEPSTALLGLLGVAGLIRRRR